jgi:hypothetical protein
VPSSNSQVKSAVASVNTSGVLDFLQESGKRQEAKAMQRGLGGLPHEQLHQEGKRKNNRFFKYQN